MFECDSLVVSLLPREFRVGQAPNFSEMAEIIYSWPGTEYCAAEDVLGNSANLNAYFQARFGRSPEAIIVFEPWDPALFECLRSVGSRIILITEDLHLRPLPLVRAAVEASTLVLARFNIINELLGDSYSHIYSFPLHCSSVFLSSPNLSSANRIIHFGNLETAPPNVNPGRSPAANQYAYRKTWHGELQLAAGDRYSHVRLPPEELRRAMRDFTFGFSCTYFPYSFSDQCALEQGEEWAKVNRPYDASRSYLVAKFFEISGSGMVMLADPSGVEEFLSEAGFQDGLNYLAIRPDTMKSTLSYIFDERNADHIASIRKNGYDLIMMKHTISARKATYHEHLQRLLANGSIGAGLT